MNAEFTATEMKERKLEMFRSAVMQMGQEPYGDHGVLHWRNVYGNCLAISKPQDPTEDLFYWYFAVLHDCCRVDDGKDSGHALRASRLVERTSDFSTRLNYAISTHSLGSTSDDPLIGTCWDADREEVRANGGTVREEAWSTERGKNLFGKMRLPPMRPQGRERARELGLGLVRDVVVPFPPHAIWYADEITPLTDFILDDEEGKS